MRRRYDRQGILALYPQAFFELFVEPESSEVETADGNAVITIRGPLEHHEGWWCDSYESILDRVTEACAGTASAIVLKIDSPGGELFGCFDAARAIRARCKAAGKRLVAYVEGCACSSAYALACSAEQIVISETAYAGSIGILITRVDLTVRDAREGVGFALVASGKRKADGHPHSSLTVPELEAMQGQCDALAELFFELVSSLRTGLATDAVRAFEADIFHGPRAVEVGLADRVASFDELLELLKKGPDMADDQDNEEQPTSSSKDIDEARAALERAAAEGNEKAQLALAALAEDPPGDDDEEKPDDDEPDAERSAASGAASVSASSAADLANVVKAQGKRLAALEKEKDSLASKALLASRPDLGKALAAHLATMPYADAKAIVDKMPKPAAPSKADKAAGTVVAATRGNTQIDPTTAPPSTAMSADEKAFAKAFGKIDVSNNGIKREGTSLIFDAAGAARARQQSAQRQVTPRTVGEKGAAE
jgi:ClpP class serine protease